MVLEKYFKPILQKKDNPNPKMPDFIEYLHYSWVHYETGFGVPDFQNQTHQQLK